MCRITGIAFNQKHFDAIDAMTDSLKHGGPDDCGVWRDDLVSLGHRRLSILDLSPLGHQPMVSTSQRYVTAYNGEIYNFSALRKELELLGYTFKGHSDTEILLASVEAWGIKKALQQFNGMFAIALWDRQEKKLYLARDRFGEKPLYYGIVNGALIFGSELKALKCYPEFNPRINTEAIQLLLRYAYINAPLSIYEGIFKLEPGHYLVAKSDLSIEKKAYWSVESSITQSLKKPYKGSFEEGINELDRVLTEAVSLRMVSDVPVGAFLSGGVDSSTVVALMQKVSKQPVKTFSIGFDDKAYNEAPFAKAVAEHLKTDHQELYVNEQDLLSVIPKLPTLYDEPFADSSQIPTFLVSQLAKQKVTVALSGDAGDELFGGYNRYFQADRLSRLFALPYGFRKALAAIIEHIPMSAHRAIKVKKLAILLREKKANDLYQLFISQNPRAETLFMNATSGHYHFNHLSESSFRKDMMYWDAISYLPGDILTKVDRASMAVALETRIPLLDPAVFEFAWQLPERYKIKSGSGKLILKELLYRYVPKTLIDRPKTGFGIPIQDWLRGPLKEWASDSLSPEMLKQQGYLNPETVQQLWQKHLSGKQDLGYALWNILMFQQWLDNEMFKK